MESSVLASPHDGADESRRNIGLCDKPFCMGYDCLTRGECIEAGVCAFEIRHCTTLYGGKSDEGLCGFVHPSCGGDRPRDVADSEDSN